MQKKPALILVLISLCFLVYFNSLSGAFISDDLAEIPLNLKLSRASVYWAYPVNLFNALAFKFCGYNPFGYHLINVILHSLNTILVFIFLCLFFKPAPSFLAACLFAVHPVHTEAVSWISGRPYLVLTFFILVVYLLYQRSLNPPEGKNRDLRLYWLALLIFAYFLLNTFTFFALLPFLLVLSDVTFGSAKKNWKYWLPFFGLVVLRIFLARAEVTGRISYMTAATGGLSLRAHPLVDMAKSLVTHARLLFYPVKLSLYHGPVEFSPAATIASLIFLFALLLALPFIFKKSRVVFFGICLFILFLSPTFSPLIITGLVQERYIYFPSVTLCIFAAYLYEQSLYYKSPRRKVIAFICFGLIMIFFTLRTIRRNDDWKTPQGFWRSTLAVSYNNPAAHYGAGLVHYQDKEFEKAENYFKKAIKLHPSYVDAYNSLGKLYQETGRLEEAEAIFKRAIEANPKESDSYYNLGIILKEKGREDEAVNYFQKAIEVNSRDIAAMNNLGIIYAQKGRFPEAAAFFKRSLRIDPDYGAAYLNLAVAYFQQNEYALAVSNCDKALLLGQNVPDEFLEQLKPYRK